MDDTEHSCFIFIDRVACAVSHIGICISGVLVGAIALIIFANVATRTLFSWNMPFVEEWATLGMIPMSYLGLGYTLRKGKHIAANFVTSRVSEHSRNIMGFFSAFIGLLVVGFLIERSWDLLSYYVDKHTVSNGPMRTPMWIPAFTLFIGCCIFFMDIFFWNVHFVLRLIGRPGLSYTE